MILRRSLAAGRRGQGLCAFSSSSLYEEVKKEGTLQREKSFINVEAQRYVCLGRLTPRSFRDKLNSRIPDFFLKKSIMAPEGFNRWLVPPAAIGTHLCIGSIYSWSMFNDSLTRLDGVLVSSSMDWTLSHVVPVFSTSIVCLGLSAAVAGKWLEEVGPRCVGSLSSVMWGGGFLLGSLGIATHNLPLLYSGFGVIGGCGLGLGYVTPVSTLLRFFPDKPGLATGMAICGFGGGAMVAAPVVKFLLEKNFVPPEYLGTAAEVEMVLEEGKRMAYDASGQMVDVVVATTQDIANLGFSPETTQSLLEGVYVAGTGSTGCAATFATMGVTYASVMALSALSYRVPREGWTPKGYTAPTPVDKQDNTNAMITSNNVDIDEALRTPQFYQLWGNMVLNVTAGISVIGLAKTMMGDVFAGNAMVDGNFCAAYVGAVSLANMLGRLGWASASDYLGRKTTFAIFFGLGAPLYMSIPYTASLAQVSDGVIPLVMFTTSTLTIFTMYGGGFSTSKEVHGVLSVWTLVE